MKRTGRERQVPTCPDDPCCPSRYLLPQLPEDRFFSIDKVKTEVTLFVILAAASFAHASYYG